MIEIPLTKVNKIKIFGSRLYSLLPIYVLINEKIYDIIVLEIYLKFELTKLRYV